MFVAVIKNYFRHIGNLLIVMGVVYLGFGVALGVLYFAFADLVVDQSQTVVGTLLQIFLDATRQFGVSNFFDGGLGVVVDLFWQLVGDRFEVGVARIGFAIGLVIFVVLVSFQVASYLCRRNIRKDIKTQKTRNFVIAFGLRFLFGLAYATVFAFFAYHLWYSVILLIVLFFGLRAVFDTIEVNAIYFKDKKLSEVLTIKNIIFYVVYSIFLFVATLVVVGLIWVWGNIFFALAIGIPLVLYLLEVVRYTTVELY